MLTMTRLTAMSCLILCYSHTSIASPVSAPSYLFGGSKLLLTGGVSQIEGSAGGGLTPWAVIGGAGTQDQLGAAAFYTRVNVNDYHLDSYGALFGLYDRLELSISQQRFDTGAPGVAVRGLLGVSTDDAFALQQTIYGLKLRVMGDAILDQDRWLPQISVGMQHKETNSTTETVAKAVGADSGKGTDIYLSATKLYLAQSILTNLTLRATKANQFGLLGFGGDKNNRYQMQVEGSIAYLLRNNLAIGAEFRTKPDNLGFSLSGQRVLAEEDAFDVFMAYALSKNNAITLAYVDLGQIVSYASTAVGGSKTQRGFYLSTQYSF
ncbi:DUF3034 family protein [Agitococcus lubricus]|uniref:DUF3034 family protein n=1 Tax=Agitococcus lubricus TaxID=1077255 RepID=A0A2T5IWW8_9GAMM|nr:DUF3034 family protein [Agitococcus lubricus]PTQ88441.1 Protein of unknown function (DUF3034) [Agitococcus lubricus]